MRAVVAIAKHDFSGQSENELSFKTGAKIIVTSPRQPGDWWKGEVDGKRGFFPSSFCEIRSEAVPLPADASAKIAALSQDNSQAVPSQLTDLPCNHTGYVRALYNFTASREDEMDLQRGAVYRIIARHGDWFVGEDDTRRGEFPCTYVEWVPNLRPLSFRTIFS